MSKCHNSDIGIKMIDWSGMTWVGSRMIKDDQGWSTMIFQAPVEGLWPRTTHGVWGILYWALRVDWENKESVGIYGIGQQSWKSMKLYCFGNISVCGGTGVHSGQYRAVNGAVQRKTHCKAEVHGVYLPKYQCIWVGLWGQAEAGDKGQKWSLWLTEGHTNVFTGQTRGWKTWPW